MNKRLVAVVAALVLAYGTIEPDATLADGERPSGPAFTLPDAVAELETFLDGLAQKDEFSGTVLLAKFGGTEVGNVVYSAAYGLASKRFDVPNNIQTRLNLGSMNKMFTATAVMQLVERGHLRLDDRLSKFLDESWLPHTVSDRIEIQHLLTHASGLGSYFNEEFWNASKRRFRVLADYKPLIAGDTLQFEPGTGYRYSNTGMFLLGAVIEAVSGQDYFDYIRQHIYASAGMIHSDCYEMDQPVPNLAIGYLPSETNETGWENNLYLHVLKGGPAGGCFSTVEDLNGFAAALTAHRLLSPENTEKLFTPKSEFHQEPYGYGFRMAGEAGNRIVGHSGGFPGISANLDIFLDAGFVAAVLSNYGGAARPVRGKIRELVTRIGVAD